MNPLNLTLTQPDDWHLHLRDGAFLGTTVAHSAKAFRRAIVMPNLQPPITSVAAALDYRHRILAQVPAGNEFDPLMTLYLTDSLALDEIDKLHDSAFVYAVKYYPAGATTNSDNGVTAIAKVMPVLERMAELAVPLLIHGEVTDADIDIFDREAVFIDTILDPLRNALPELKIVLEHITSAQAVQFVMSADPNLAATITAHHLLHNRNHMLAGGIRPHYYCLPILKRDTHQKALIKAATSGNSKFFLGSDSAPHPLQEKQSPCGCAGIYTAPGAIELYAEVFESAGALDKLEGFASCYGAEFYSLPRNTGQLVLNKKDWQMPDDYEFGQHRVVPIRAGQSMSWQVSEVKR